MRREELMIALGLLLIVAVGGYFKWNGNETPIRPVVVDGERTTAEAGRRERATASSQSDAQSETGFRDINTATRRDLMAVRGIGESLAGAILAYRERNGPFRTMAEVGRVSGIGDKRLAALRESFRVSGTREEALRLSVPDGVPTQVDRPAATATPGQTARLAPPTQGPGHEYPLTRGPGLVDLNTATGPQLESLPGIGPVIAGRILEYRTFRGGFRSVNELLDVDGIGPIRMREIRPLVTVKNEE